MAGKTAVLSLKIIGDATSAQRAAGTTKKELSNLEKAGQQMSTGLKVAGVAAGAGLMKGLADAIDAGRLENKLAAQLNLSSADAAAAGDLAGSLYRDAYGESLEDVNNAIGAVGSTLTTMTANGGADVERLTKKALDLAGAFDVDVAEATTAAGAMLNSGLAKDADQAMDTIASAMQRVPAGVRDEILPSLIEYSKHYAALGLDASTVAGIMVNASAQGAIGVDKMGDALKELTIRSTDGSEATAAAYEAIGLSAEETAWRMLQGGETANDAFGQIVNGLQSVEDPVKQSAAAIALFGTPLEDLGTDQIPNFLGQIDPMGDAFQDVAGAAEEMGNKLNAGPAVQLEEFKRKALGSLQDTAAQVLPLLQPVLSFLMQFTPVLGPLAAAIAVVAGVQMLWNAALAANPIMLVVIAIVALVGMLVLAYNNVGWFKDAVDTAGRIAGAVFGAIGSWISDVVSWLVNVIGQSKSFQAALDLVKAVFSLLGTAAKIALDMIVTGVSGAINWVKSITSESETFNNILAGLKATAQAVFGAIDTAISTTIGWVRDAVGWFQSLFGAKNDAAAADAGAGARMMAEPVAMMARAAGPSALMLAQADPLALAYGASYSAVPPVATALTAATVGAIRDRAAGGGTVVNVNLEVKADATTDPVALGRALLRAINSALAATGQKKLASA